MLRRCYRNKIRSKSFFFRLLNEATYNFRLIDWPDTLCLFFENSSIEHSRFIKNFTSLSKNVGEFANKASNQKATKCSGKHVGIKPTNAFFSLFGTLSTFIDPEIPFRWGESSRQCQKELIKRREKKGFDSVKALGFLQLPRVDKQIYISEPH